jgi:hypothetical protein
MRGIILAYIVPQRIEISVDNTRQLLTFQQNALQLKQLSSYEIDPGILAIGIKHIV